MAIWQFGFQIVPKGCRGTKGSEDDIISWEGQLIPCEFESRLSQIIPINNDSGENGCIYGEYDSTCIYILKEQSTIIEISCRFDLRNLAKTLLIEILELIKLIDGEIYISGMYHAPELEILVSLMECSSAASFCIDPTDYLSKLHGRSCI